MKLKKSNYGLIFKNAHVNGHVHKLYFVLNGVLVNYMKFTLKSQFN